MENEGQPPRVKWEGDSLETVKAWPKDTKINIGADLRRLEEREEPLDQKYLGDQLYELRDRQKNVWFRLIYWLNRQWIYVLHAFEKKENETPQSDLNLAKARRAAVIKRKDAPYEEPTKGEEEESA